MRKFLHILLVIAVIIALKIFFNWLDRKWIENCEAAGGHYQREGLGEGCTYPE